MSPLSLILPALLATGALAESIDPTAVTDTTTPTTTAVASQEVATIDQPNALSIHPVTGLVTLALSGFPKYIYVTYERELGEGNSFVLQPLVVFGSIDGKFFGEEDEPPIDIFQIGSMASYRFYKSDRESKGLYLAPAAGVYYVSASQEGNWYTRGGKATAVQFGALGYLGYRFKNDGISFHTEVGYGFQKVIVSGTDNESITASGQALDINIGLGLCF